jgi:hypothetical protein
MEKTTYKATYNTKTGHKSIEGLTSFDACLDALANASYSDDFIKGDPLAIYLNGNSAPFMVLRLDANRDFTLSQKGFSIEQAQIEESLKAQDDKNPTGKLFKVVVHLESTKDGHEENPIYYYKTQAEMASNVLWNDEYAPLMGFNVTQEVFTREKPSDKWGTENQLYKYFTSNR